MSRRRSYNFIIITKLVIVCLLLSLNISNAEPLLLIKTKSMPQQRDLQAVLNFLSNQQSTVINIQRELVSRQAVGPEYGGEGEESKARWVENWLNARGIPYERLDYPDERVPAKVRPNIVARYPSANATNGKTLWLLSHLDVSAPGPLHLWDGNPFALRIDGDVMYGRGVEDNNQAITASLLLLESLLQSNIQPPQQLGIVLTSGALTGYQAGVGHVMAKRPGMFSSNDQILVMDFGKEEGNLISLGEKGNIWLKVTVEGKSGHAGTPGKANNAFAAAAELAHGLQELQQKFPAQNSLFTPPHTTFTPTRTEDFSTGINHIPAKFVFYVDARVLPDYSFDEVQKAIRQLADKVEQSDGVQISIERIESTPPSRTTSDQADVIVALGRAIRNQLGKEPEHTGTSSVTMASTLRAAGLPVAVWGIQETMHNRPEEQARISAHINQAKVLANMLFAQ
ncbi:MAG: M20 family metallo-hydrolase [Desulfovibrio sp.]|uniref:M20 family metallo-hydrolase n=1 Tax=Desulfovibrio sp. TaxID=885 RepID=UPI0039E5BC7C